MNIRPKGDELFHEDRQTGRQADGRTNRQDEVNSRFFAIM